MNRELMPLLRSILQGASCLTIGVTVATSCTTDADLEPIATITLQPSADSVELGQTYNQWVVTLRDAGGATLAPRPLTWESNNPTVATIDASTGTVTAVGGGGTTLITVRAEGKFAQASFKVLTPIVSIVVPPDSFDLPLTTTRAIPVQLVGPSGVGITNRLIEWSSSNLGVAVVSTNGVVTPISVGMTTITIKAGTKQASVRVRVVGEPVASVRITPQQSVQIVRLGQTKQLTAECLNAAQQVLTGRTITWNSNNPVVATVSGSGLISGNALGSATISANCDNTASANITAQVTPVPVASVTLTPSTVTLSVGAQSQLLATARDSAGNILSLQGRSVLWTSNNEPVATVSNTGVVTGRGIGSANVFVSVDGMVSAPAAVTITAFFSSAFPNPLESPWPVTVTSGLTWTVTSNPLERSR